VTESISELTDTGVEDNVCVDSTDHLTLNAGQLVIRRALVV
jgi:hypothetical protein